MAMENNANNEAPVQEVVRNNVEPDGRADCLGSIDAAMPNHGSPRNKGRTATRKRDNDKSAVINVVCCHGKKAMLIIPPHKNKSKSGVGHSCKHGKIFHKSSYQVSEAYSDRLRYKKLELHKKNAEILDLMIKSNVPTDTLKAFISKASFD